jgi:hypothetical protein
MYGLRREQLIGMVLGAVLGGFVSGTGRVPGRALTLGEGLLWGAAIGGILSAIPQFGRSGAVLTRRTHAGVNLLVGLAGGLVYIVVIVLLAILLTKLLL